MRKLRQKLNIIWEGAQTLDGSEWVQNRRYVPESLTGGPGWGVWDNVTKRFLSDQEVLKIDPEESLPVH